MDEEITIINEKSRNEKKISRKKSYRGNKKKS